MDKGQVSSDIPQAGTVTGEDKEVTRLSTEDSVEDRELEQLLSAQERMVIHTDEVTVTEDAQPAGNPEASSDSGRPQVRQFNWSPNQALTMMVPVWIGRRQVMAVVDTAAQVTIMSRALSEALGCEAPVEKVQLRNAQQDSWMDGGIHEHFGFQLGGKKYYWDVVEADIGDSFIIGIDFLKSVKCKIDLDGNNLELANGDRIPATLKRNTDSGAVHVSRVLLHRKTTIPPKSMKLVRATLESPADVPFLVEPKESSSLFAVPVMVGGNGPLKVCLVNLGEELISLKRKQNLATAVEIDALVDTEDVEETREKDIGGCESVKAILVFLARQLGKDPERLGEFVSAKGWLQDMEPTLSVSREVLGKQLAVYWRGTVETVATPSPSDVAALLHWRTMMRLLAEVPEGVRSQVRQAPLVDGSAGVLSGAVAIDGHCHLELMRQQVGWKSTIESALGELAESHASAELAGLEAVVTNSVFWDEWITRIPASIGSIRVLQTWGVHPKAVKNVNWCWMEEKLAAAECVAVGECGLDETAGDMELQEKVFKRQILIAHQLKKPLVLHLRGKTSRTTSALYGRALALTTAVLHKRHKIYLHSFSAGQAEFQLWYRSFPELLVGCSWLTTSELSRETMLRSMPATVLALETDSPHLASRSGIVNSPYRIYEQAVTIGRIRNLPTSTVIECSNRALRRFYAL